MRFSKLATVSIIALAAFAGSEIAASAQSAPSDQPGTTYVPYHRTEMRGYRPLTVNRHPAPAPVVIAAPVIASAPVYGPGVIVTAPFHAVGSVVGMPFQLLGGVFPSQGNVATSPLVLVGAPLYAAGQIVQFPFRVVDAMFGAIVPAGGPVLVQ